MANVRVISPAPGTRIKKRAYAVEWRTGVIEEITIGRDVRDGSWSVTAEFRYDDDGRLDRLSPEILDVLDADPAMVEIVLPGPRTATQR